MPDSFFSHLNKTSMRAIQMLLVVTAYSFLLQDDILLYRYVLLNSCYILVVILMVFGLINMNNTIMNNTIMNVLRVSCAHIYAFPEV